MKGIYRGVVAYIGEFSDDCPQIPGSIVEGFQKLGKGRRQDYKNDRTVYTQTEGWLWKPVTDIRKQNQQNVCMCMSVGMWREGEGEDEREREKEQGTDHANVKLYKDRLSRSKTHRVGSQNRKIAGMLEPLAQMETVVFRQSRRS